MSPKTYTFEDLNEDVLRIIFDKFCDFKTQLRAQRVNRRLFKVIDSIFFGKRALYLAEDSQQLYDICDEDFNGFTKIFLTDLYDTRDGLWLRGEDRALRLLQPIDCQMLTLKKFTNLSALSLVIKTRSQLNSLLDLILQNCVSNVEKLILIIKNGNHFSINMKQMEDVCRQYSNLKHFEIYSDYIYTSEDCFTYLLSHCQSLQVFKLNVRQVFRQTVELLGANGSQAITYDAFNFNASAFDQISGRLSTICATHPILNDSLFNRLTQMGDKFSSVRHLEVDKIYAKDMRNICQSLNSLEVLALSMHYSLETNISETNSLFSYLSQLKNLRKLSIHWFCRRQTANAVPFDAHTLRSLKDCTQLSDLTVKEALLSFQTLEGIKELVPYLESLAIINCSINSLTLSAIPLFSRLKHLLILKTNGDQTSSYVLFDDNKRGSEGMNENTIRNITDLCFELHLLKGNDLNLELEPMDEHIEHMPQHEVHDNDDEEEDEIIAQIDVFDNEIEMNLNEIFGYVFND